MISLFLAGLLAASDDTALEAKLKAVRRGDTFPFAEQLPSHSAPWKVRQAASATGRPDCRGYAYLLEGEGSPPWVALTVFCGKSLVRVDAKQNFVDWPIMADFDSCQVKLRLTAVDALAAQADAFWLTETAVCDGELLAEEFAYRPEAGRLAQVLKAVCADPAAGRVAPQGYRSAFQGQGYPKPFTCGALRFEFRRGAYRMKGD